MTAPSAGRDDATIRGAVVLVVAIVIGLALLARTGGGGDEADADAGPTTASTEVTTTTAAAGDATTVPIEGATTTSTAPATGDTQVPSEITVAVINATETVGWAADNAAILGSAGYVTETGNPASGNADASLIYSTPEAQADAQAVARLLSLDSAAVDVKPDEPLASNGSDADADIVVVLGADSVSG